MEQIETDIKTDAIVCRDRERAKLEEESLCIGLAEGKSFEVADE